MIHFRCPRCRQAQAISAERAGAILPCCSCGYPLKVPQVAPVEAELILPGSEPEPQEEPEALTGYRCYECGCLIREGELQARTITSLQASRLGFRLGNRSSWTDAGAHFSHDRVPFCEACAWARDARVRRRFTVGVVVVCSILGFLLCAGIVGTIVNAQRVSAPQVPARILYQP